MRILLHSLASMRFPNVKCQRALTNNNLRILTSNIMTNSVLCAAGVPSRTVLHPHAQGASGWGRDAVRERSARI